MADQNGPVQKKGKNQEIKGDFFPAKNMMGGDHKKRGVYLSEDGEITIYKTEGYKANSVKFKIDDIGGITHYAKFKFMFLLVIYRWEAVNSIVFMNKKNQAFATLPIQNFKPKNLISFLKEISSRNSEIELGTEVNQAIDKNNYSPLMNNYWKAVWKGIRWWIVASVVIVALVLVVSVLGS